MIKEEFNSGGLLKKFIKRHKNFVMYSSGNSTKNITSYEILSVKTIAKDTSYKVGNVTIEYHAGDEFISGASAFGTDNWSFDTKEKAEKVWEEAVVNEGKFIKTSDYVSKAEKNGNKFIERIFIKKGKKFYLLDRNEEACLYAVTPSKIPYIQSYEVMRIQKVKKGSLVKLGDVTIEYKEGDEFLPRDNQWGKMGWTFCSYESAIGKFNEIS